MRDVVIAGAVRTAIGNLGGILSGVTAIDLGAASIDAALKKAGVPARDIDEVVMGQVLQANCGLNPARQASLAAGIPVTVPAFTVNKVCASGLKAVALGALSIAAGEQEIVVAGGMESMSNAPYFLSKARSGYRLGNGEIVDSILRDALIDPGSRCHMGTTAETLAREYSITRREQDEFAVQSQRKAHLASEGGCFCGEMIQVTVPQRKGAPLLVERDEFIKPDSTVEILAGLKPVFSADGSVTAGNSSGINDGAAAMVLLSSEEAKRRRIEVNGKIIGFASSALEPERMGLGPVEAVRRVLRSTELKLDDIGLIELNEAFAAQSIAVIRELELAPERVNVHGGAIALGHPVGATGARILVTLLHALSAGNEQLGLAALCVGGGQGMACIVERSD